MLLNNELPLKTFTRPPALLMFDVHMLLFLSPFISDAQSISYFSAHQIVEGTFNSGAAYPCCSYLASPHSSCIALATSLHFLSSICISRSPEYEHIVQVPDLLPGDTDVVRNSYFGEGCVCWCYLAVWEQIALVPFVGQLCHQWCKLCSPLCNHLAAIHIQMQTMTKRSLSLSVDTCVFSSHM